MQCTYIQGAGWSTKTVNDYGQDTDFQNTEIVLAQQEHFI